MSLNFHPMPTPMARAFQCGTADANGQVPEQAISDGGGNPCRHCLKMIPKDAPFLILGYRPFDSINPYTEIGPVFLCANACAAPNDATEFPEILASPTYLVRGYGSDERIKYGTGSVVARDEITMRAAALLADAAIEFVHVRSASNNCYHLKITKD